MSCRRLLLPPPQTQALSTSTFRLPPLDGSLSLVEIYDWHLANNPGHRLFKFAQQDGIIRTICWNEAVRAIYLGAKLVRDHIGRILPEEEAPVIAIVAPSADAIPYFTMLMSIMRANCVVFPVSPRNSPAALAHLISKTNVTHIFVGREPAMSDLGDAALAIAKEKDPSATLPTTSPMPLFEELYLSQEEMYVTADDVPYTFRGSDAIAMILHSSGTSKFMKLLMCSQRLPGSTAFPKPIYWTNHRVSEQSLIPFFGELGYDWEYFRFPDLVQPHMVPYGDNTFELIVVSNIFCTPSVLNTKIDGTDAYATSDLMIPHPTKLGYWKIYGRTDDQIMHSTGEKVTSNSLQNILNQDPHVLCSVMFGRGRFQVGVIIEPKPAFRFDLTDQGKLAEYRNKIWPTIENMNSFAPQHSRLFKEMIIVAKASKPFTYTAKNTARRHAVISDYAEEINTLYDVVDESTQSSIPSPTHWDIVTATEFVRAVVVKVLGHTVHDDDDLFHHGCDSLQATWIRNSVLRALRDSACLDTRQTSANFVYDHPSICHLASFAISMASGCAGDVKGSKSGRLEAMQAMVARYTGQYPTRPEDPLQSRPSGDIVLVTGTTGSLGCHLLARLVDHIGILRVYALNRASGVKGTSLVDRQRSALQHQGLDFRIADSGKVVLLEGDMAKDNWGLEPSHWKCPLSHFDISCDSAWRIDFNLSLASFEANVKSVRSLIDFSMKSRLSDPPHLIFAGSIGVFQNPEGDQPQSEHPIPPHVAIGTGYTESKWVSEQIICHAISETSLKALIVRVGQLCGTSDGTWNLHEWFPSMVQSTLTLGCFPSDPRNVSWIPIDLAASALVEFRGSSVDSNVVHLIHPRPVSWNMISDVISSQFSVPLVPYTDWLQGLESMLPSQNRQQANAADTFTDIAVLRENRALRLLPFFKHLSKASGGDALGSCKLSMSRALSCSPMLSSISNQLTPAIVEMWLARWREEGLFSSARHC
ncbi:NAD(P)-binding protein [Wolfiporia cocos MD-104 SS10]|uniref:NAD(P)-binding protein n=1 Tax=Wolfiporia cocos (strain MD-104) TaxID=742152 RepID=A0A2H3JB74_WOLCO|nr:NAD(P)-binding protein [Wolfiporia cocos MD-104 SS10]